MSERTIKTQFSDYDGEFPILDGFADSSWGNDACPSQERQLSNGSTVRVWFDYADPAKRERSGSNRFCVDITGADGEAVDQFSSDSLEDIRLYVGRMLTGLGETPAVSVPSLAAAFCRELAGYLTAAQMAEINLRNHREADKSICHSHDFCDANQMMLDAMAQFGIALEVESDSQLALVNAAWALASSVQFVAGSCGLAVGNTVRFANPLTDGERVERFKVLELRGSRVLLEFVCDMRIRPTFNVMAVDVVRV